MNVSDWVNVGTSASLIYFAWQQNRIFKEQNRIFAAQGGQAAMPSKALTNIAWLQRYWPTALMLLALLMTAYDVYDRHATPHFDRAAKLELVTDKAFRNERVNIDGKEFRNCTFDDVSLVYNGHAPVMMVGDTFRSTLMITTDDPSVGSTIGILSALGFMPGVTKYSDEPITIRKER